MSSNLKVNTILPSAGSNIGLGTNGGNLNVDGGCKVQVGTALTLGHSIGLQFATQNLHSAGFEINQINASGIITASQFKGDGSQLTGISGVSVANQADNRLITATGTTDALNGEANLTFDGNNLQNLQSGAAANLTLKATSNSFNSLILDSNRSANTQFAILDGRWNGNPVARIQYVTGSDGTNKDDGYMAFHTRTSGASLAERLRIASDGKVGINVTDPDQKLEVDGIIKGSSYFQAGASGTASHNWHFGAEGNGQFKIYNGNYGAGNEKLRIDSNGMITLGESSNTALKAEVCNANNGHYFVSQCNDNSNGFEIYQQHGSTSTRNSFAVYANTGSSSSKQSQFIIAGDNNAYFRGNVMPEANDDVDLGTDARTWRQVHYLNGYPAYSTVQITSGSSFTSSSWYNTGFSRGSIGGLNTNGLYIITLFADTWAAGGGNYSCNYTWIVGMRNQSTNQTKSDNIPLLSVTGHSTNNVYYELRTTRQAAVHGGDEYLQWRCTANLSSIDGTTNGRVMKWYAQRIGRSSP